MEHAREAWVTGVGIVSCLGEGAEATWRALTSEPPASPVVDGTTFSPYPVHPLAAIDAGRYIPSKADQKQMGTWQRIGVHAAGLALEDAGIAKGSELLDRVDLVVAAGNGERDEEIDARVLETLAALPEHERGPKLNEMLSGGLRPTLYLGELSNLLAGNIQIVHKVTGSSRTLKGEEIAGASAVENAARRVKAAQADIVLVGGALNAERDDLLLGYELGGNLWARPYAPVWQRAGEGGGAILGSAGAFLVVEEKSHALARGATGYARIVDVVTERCRRAASGDLRASLSGLLARLAPVLKADTCAILSGASGVEPATSSERDVLASASDTNASPVSAFGSRFGHTMEAHFPLGVALACLALRHGSTVSPCDGEERGGVRGMAPAQILVTGVGHWRGEGMALLERVASEVVP